MPRRSQRARRLLLRSRMPRIELWADFDWSVFSFLVAPINSETYGDTKLWEPVFQQMQRITLMLVNYFMCSNCHRTSVYCSLPGYKCVRSICCCNCFLAVQKKDVNAALSS